MVTRRVLFIDDDTSVLDMLSRNFAKLDYQTFTAASGREGVNEFLRIRPDVTVVDLHMPDISGFNVLEELRPKRPMVIMLTGDGEIDNAVEAMRRGAETFLTKPVKLSHLEVAVAKAAEKAALNREVRTLRSRLTPSPRRRIARVVAVVALVAASVGLGSAIGGRETTPPTAVIPVPFDPQDPVIERPDVPFKPIPDPRERDRRDGNR